MDLAPTTDALRKCVLLLSGEQVAVERIGNCYYASVPGSMCCARSRSGKRDAIRQLVVLLAAWVDHEH
jgi:hypothetical protein